MFNVQRVYVKRVPAGIRVTVQATMPRGQTATYSAVDKDASQAHKSAMALAGIAAAKQLAETARRSLQDNSTTDKGLPF